MRDSTGSIPRQSLRRRTLLAQRRRRSQRNAALAGLFVLLAAVAVLLSMRSGGRVQTASARGDGTAGAHLRQAAPGSAQEGMDGPTPVFAFADKVVLSLPFPRQLVTLIAYHQVYTDQALRMVPAPQLNTGFVKRGSKESITARRAIPQRRLYRSDRGGPADRAVDIGTKINTAVRAPVSGRVVKVKSYMLYGKYPDYEIDIQPSSNPLLKVQLFHIHSVRVKRGTRVESGITPIGRVRDIARYFQPQIAEYTHERGNHIHIQIKRIDSKP